MGAGTDFILWGEEMRLNEINEIKEQEVAILQILSRETKPMGSGQLRKLLLEKGFQISEATVGRVLSEMDQKNLTRKSGYQGRLISENGRHVLDKIDNINKQNKYGSRFLSILSSKSPEDLIDMLVARRAIERELARLAALNATDAEIQLMETVLRKQEELALKNEMTAEQDVRFHKLVAMAAKNKVLAAALDLIRQGGQLAPVLEFIRKEVRGTLAVEHAQILRAIINRDPGEAERAMVNHIESIIADVEKYWQTSRSPNL